MNDNWPDLAIADLPATLDALHLWTQVVGKVKLATLPWLNESWHVPLYVSATGLTTGLIATERGGFELAFDFAAGVLRLTTSDGHSAEVALVPMSVARFHASVVAMLEDAGLEVEISPRPSEIEGAIPFAEDTAYRPFDIDGVRAWWRALIQVQRVFHRFRSRFVGKNSPIHFFWGSFDLAVTRFSGRPAPAVTRGGPNMSVAVAQDAYAGEQVSCGFWPGGKGIDGPHFYVEAWPAPAAFATAEIGPHGAYYSEALDEWLLPYALVRGSAYPDATLLDFLQSGCAAVADADGWDRARLERPEGPIGRPPAEG